MAEWSNASGSRPELSANIGSNPIVGIMKNIDIKTTEGFGLEWKKFDQSDVSNKELESIFNSYFDIFPWHIIDKNSIGFDMGCGSGRWDKFVSPKVKQLHCIDASKDALDVAKTNLKQHTNCIFYHESVGDNPLSDNSMDFGMCLGVLHHVPDTLSGLRSCTASLKPKAPFLLYLYYRFDNKPLWFRTIWKASDLIRRFVSNLPFILKYIISQTIAATIYYPVTRILLILENNGINVDSLPLAPYRKFSYYTMRTDAFDRFSTRLEKRFTKPEILELMTKANLENITFSDKAPFWHAVGYKK